MPGSPVLGEDFLGIVFARGKASIVSGKQVKKSFVMFQHHKKSHPLPSAFWVPEPWHKYGKAATIKL